MTFDDGHDHDVDASFLDYIGDQGHDRFLSEGWILWNAYNNAVFSPALEEALIPTNLTNIGMAFARSDQQEPYDSLSAASQRIPRSRGRLLSSIATAA